MAVFLATSAATSFLVCEARADDAASEADGRERSRAMFRKGVLQLRSQDWAAARASFEVAWGLYPHPSILLNLGVARLRTDDPVRAEQDLVRFLSEDVGASPEELAGAREALGEARTKLATVRVEASPAIARVAVDGRAVETVRRADPGSVTVVAEVRLKPGRHSVVAEADGYTSSKREVDVTAKSEAFVKVALARTVATPAEPRVVILPVANAPPSTGPKVRTVVGWTLAGLSTAALIAGGITAFRAKSLSDSYADPSSSRFQDPELRTEGIDFRTTADVMLGAAVLTGGAALLLLLITPSKHSVDVSRRDSVFRW